MSVLKFAENFLKYTENLRKLIVEKKLAKKQLYELNGAHISKFKNNFKTIRGLEDHSEPVQYF